jgi:hypothetical protein
LIEAIEISVSAEMIDGDGTTDNDSVIGTNVGNASSEGNIALDAFSANERDTTIHGAETFASPKMTNRRPSDLE